MLIDASGAGWLALAIAAGLGCWIGVVIWFATSKLLGGRISPALRILMDAVWGSATFCATALYLASKATHLEERFENGKRVYLNTDSVSLPQLFLASFCVCVLCVISLEIFVWLLTRRTSSSDTNMHA